MILYGERNPAPNPRRVRIFIAEKGIDLPETRLELAKGEHKSEAHRARNSLGQVPTLELDDGTAISESVAICRYLDDIYPDPPLFGRTPYERANIDMWCRRMENVLMGPLGQYWVHAHPFTAKIINQFKDFGESNKARYEGSLKWFDGELADRPFVAGDAYTMADILALTSVDFGDFIGLHVGEEHKNIARWRAAVSSRPSADA